LRDDRIQQYACDLDGVKRSVAGNGGIEVAENGSFFGYLDYRSNTYI
jgi:hypothetical protein